jgi:poly(3-hydroxybutyrate) depolymerase
MMHPMFADILRSHGAPEPEALELTPTPPGPAPESYEEREQRLSAERSAARIAEMNRLGRPFYLEPDAGDYENHGPGQSVSLRLDDGFDD